MKQFTGTRKLVLSAVLLAAGLVLPFLTGQIPKIGNMLLPMHIPVLLCGLLCGWRYGGVVGFITPVLRSVLFGMPLMFPNAVAMAFELMTYGIVAGFLYGMSPWKCIVALYRALVTGLLAGRLVWGGAMLTLLGAVGSPFTVEMFLAGALFNAIPGIIIQLTLIPALMLALGRTGLVPFHRHSKEKCSHCS